MREGPSPRHLLAPALLAATVLSGAAAPTGAVRSYALGAPDLNLTLPARLNEVSGVTSISDTELACVQDEEGVVFVYDLQLRRITRQIPFGPPGDYEGIARVGSRLFVLRSDGPLFEIRGLSGRPAVKLHQLKLPTADNEGLCFDALRNRLLIVPKSRLGKGKNLKDARAIFSFDLNTATLQQDPIVVLDVDAMRTFAEQGERESRGRQQTKGGKARPTLSFMPSAAAVHPLTSEIFIVSAVDRVLVTCDQAGRVTGVVPLDPKLFRQPEGLTFLSSGDLVVTNEAAGRQPTLLVFKPSRTGSRSGARN